MALQVRDCEKLFAVSLWFWYSLGNTVKQMYGVRILWTGKYCFGGPVFNYSAIMHDMHMI